MDEKRMKGKGKGSIDHDENGRKMAKAKHSKEIMQSFDSLLFLSLIHSTIYLLPKPKHREIWV